MSQPYDPDAWQAFVNSIGRATAFLSQRTGGKFQGVILHQDDQGRPQQTIVPDTPPVPGPRDAAPSDND